MSINNVIKNFVFQQAGAGAALRLDDDSDFDLVPSVEEIGPLLVAPVASPFGGRRKERSFPLYKKGLGDSTRLVPQSEEDLQLDEDYEDIEIEELPESLESLLGDYSKKGKVDFTFGIKAFDYLPAAFRSDLNRQIGPEITKATFGVPQTFNPGEILDFTASLSGTPVAASYVGEKNLQQLQYAQAMAGLGKKGYGVGIVNGQVVGVTPSSIFDSSGQNIIGTTPISIRPEDADRIREKITGKSGPMRAGIEAFKNIRPQTPITQPMRRFEQEILKAKGIPDYLKSEILGFNIAPGRYQAEFGTPTPSGYRRNIGFADFKADYESSRDLGTGDERDEEIDTQTYIAPTFPTTIDQYVKSTDSSDSDYNDDSAATSMGDEGFGGGGGFATAYGGRIPRSYGGGNSQGFVSKKTPNKITIRGVGLIKPEETFLRTDMVDDRYAVNARAGDYIVNGPASERFKDPLILLAKLGINNLKNKGVDIEVGKPKIPSKEKVPLLTASSENYFPKEIVENINPNDSEEGYRILEAINDIGKPEVNRLIKQLKDQPTDLSKYQTANKGKKVEKEITIQEAYKKQIPVNKFSDKVYKRNLTRNNIKKMNPLDALVVTMWGEANALGDKGMEGVAHTVVNRTNYKEKKGGIGINNLYGTLSARTGKEKRFEYNALEPDVFEKSLKHLVNNKKDYDKVMDIALEVVQGTKPDFTEGALFFWNPFTSTSDWYKNQVHSGRFKSTGFTKSPNNKKLVHQYHTLRESYIHPSELLKRLN